MVKKLQALKAKKGFTLVELIVVIAIIGVLAAILVPTMLNMVTKSRVTSANSTAASLKNNIGSFMTDADSKGYGPKQASGKVQVININVSGGEWTVAACTKDNFKGDGSAGVPQWGAASDAITATDDMSTVGVAKAENQLASYLAKLFPDIKQAAIVAHVVAGNVALVCYTAEASDVADMGTLPTLQASTNAVPKAAVWDGKTAGISDEGLIVGTAPAVDIADQLTY